MRKSLAAFLAAAVAAVFAQSFVTGQAPQGPTFRTSVDVLAVDVSVVDERGRPVSDLGAADFVVEIDGRPRRVVSAEFVRVDAGQAAAPAEPAEPAAETFYTTNVAPPSGRLIVVAVDQLAIGASAYRVALNTAARFVEDLNPADRVAFVAYPEPGISVDFTTDRARIRRALERIVPRQVRPQSSVSLALSEAIGIAGQDPSVMATVFDRECGGLRDDRQRDVCATEIAAEAVNIASRTREETQQSLNGLRTLFQELTSIDAPKSILLFTEGLVLERSSDLNVITDLAAKARATVNVLRLEVPPGGGATQARMTLRPGRDRSLVVEGLEHLAGTTRGALFHIVGSGETILDRVRLEMSAYYLLGVEQLEGDRDGERHDIKVETGRRGVTVRSRQAFVLSSPTTGGPTAHEQLRDALRSPFGLPGLPLRVTTFARQDAASGKARLTVAAEVGQPGAPATEFALGYQLLAADSRIVASSGEEVMLSPVNPDGTGPLQYVGGLLVDPGTYTLRFAAVDREGRQGSVVRDVNVWKMSGEEFATADLVVGNVPVAGRPLTPSIEPHVSTGAVTAYLELYSTATETLDRTSVTFEIAADEDSPAITATPARVTAGSQQTWRVAQAFVGAESLRPGHYVARAHIARDGRTVGVLARPFVLEGSPSAGIASPAAGAGVPAAAILPPVPEKVPAFSVSLPRFSREAALTSDLVASMLDLVDKRSPSLKSAVAAARAGRYEPAALEAFTAGDPAVAAFLRGLHLYAEGQLSQAATQLQFAAGPRRQFFPAAFYLGAVFAAAGRDRDAAGVWQLALGTEARPAPVYVMVADARLRDGQPGSAIDVLKPAYERDRTNDDIAKRLAIAYVMTDRHADALPVIDDYLTRHPDDQDLLLAAIAAYHETARAGRALSDADRARLRAYAEAYTGDKREIVDRYLGDLGV